MDSAKPTTVDWLKILAWLDVNKWRVIKWAMIVISVVAVITLFIYYEYQKEVRASRALSEITVPFSPTKSAPPGLVEALLKVERDHPNTKAAARAVVEAGGILFSEGKYDEAEKLFARFEKQYPESTWLPQALFGYATTLEAKNQTTNALAEYEKLRKRYPNDAIADYVKLGLGRLNEKQNKLEEALALYQEILRLNPPNYSSLGAEAGSLYEDLLQKHPELIKTNAPPTNVLSTLTATNASLAAKPASNRTQTLSLTNVIKRTNAPVVTPPATNRPGTNVPLLIQPAGPTSAPPAAPK
jgi:tetratricopeptide (TPR) repeat protein